MAGTFPAPTIDDGWRPASGVMAAQDALGHDVLIDWCIALLRRDVEGADPRTPSLRWIGGRAAGSDAERRYWARDDLTYWPRAWAARALRYVWDDSAARPVIDALADDAWRVREHCCTVVRLRELADAAEKVATLTDPRREATLRVRLAAVRALAVVGEFEHADALRQAIFDPEPRVSDAAGTAIRVLAERLDRNLG